MSITNELRKEALGIQTFTCMAEQAEQLLAIADRIDAEAEDNERFRREAEPFCDRLREASSERADVTLFGIDYTALPVDAVRLPVDADGEYIHIGDEMEGVDKYDSLKKVRGKVITVSFESDGTVDVAIQAWSSDGKSWHRAFLDPNASVYRHYHEPTVDDLLFSYGQSCIRVSNEAGTDAAKQTMLAKLREEYAAKLRLADGGKE